MTALETKIKEKTATIAVLGLGYVGLSLMDAFGRAGLPVIGYDRNKHKIEDLNKGQNYLLGVNLPHLFALLKKGSCTASADQDSLNQADVFIVAVPTSLDVHRQPDLSKVRSAANIISKHLKKGSLVIVQSTSFPGTTQQEILPILRQSHLKEGVDFHLAFIPEISDFGNTQFDFAKIPKIVGGLTRDCGRLAKKLYEHITEDVTVVSSPAIAEAAKILQNTYRLINISLINEMKMMFDRMGIDIWEVIDAAAKKPFGFVPFYPGPGIGGDCIPVDPYYLVWKARETAGPTALIELAGEINAHMPQYVVAKVVDALAKDKKPIKNADVLVLGAAFKKDVNDIRESACLAILSELQKKGSRISYHDPYVKALTPSQRFPNLLLRSIEWQPEALSKYDCVVILTDHTFYDWEVIFREARCIVDTRNVSSKFQEQMHKVTKA